MKLRRNRYVEWLFLRAKTAWDFTIAKLAIALLTVLRKLPAQKSANAAEKIGRFLAPVLPRTKLAKRNLARAFPEKTTEEINQIARNVWGNVARTIAEYVFLDELFRFDLFDQEYSTVDVVGIGEFIKISKSNQPTIIFTGHTGNWEILPVAASTYGLPVTALFRPPNNRFLADHLLKARETANGQLVPSMAGAAWALSGVLHQNGAVGILADQAFRLGPHIDFLGRTATANPLAAKLARQFDCKIYPARCVRQPSGRFRLELLPPLAIPKDENGHVDVVATTKLINQTIEGWVKEHPEQWLWLHDRWKIKEPEKAKWRR